MVVFDVVTFGSAVIDSFVYTDVSKKGEFLHYPVGAKILIENLRFDVGGGGTNTAVAFSRFGLKTGCVCGVGDDNNGKDILDLLKKEKIAFLGCVKKSKVKNNSTMTGYSVILDSKDKDRTILTFKGVNDNIGLNEVLSFKTKWVYYSSLLGKSFKSQEKLAMRLAKGGVKIAFNPSLYHIKNIDLSGLLKRVYVLILNKEEAELLVKKYNKKKEILNSLYELGPRIIVVTDKNNPVRCFDGEKVYSVKPNKKVKVVERTGAGDAFASGFVAGLVVGYSVEKSLKLGLEEGESVIQHFGAKNNLIKRKLR